MSDQLEIIKSLAAKDNLVQVIKSLAAKAQAAPVWDQRSSLIALFAAVIFDIECKNKLIDEMIKWMQLQEEKEKNGKR